MKKRLKTIVCGTNFGEFYLYALEKMNSEFEIVGIIGRGSERTKKFSKNIMYHCILMLKNCHQI